MSYIFAVAKVGVPLIDPQSRKPVGTDVKDFTKVFEGEAGLCEVQEWAKKLGANACTLMFETEEPK